MKSSSLNSRAYFIIFEDGSYERNGFGKGGRSIKIFNERKMRERLYMTPYFIGRTQYKKYVIENGGRLFMLDLTDDPPKVTEVDLRWI